jgi:hypothetical protein
MIYVGSRAIKDYYLLWAERGRYAVGWTREGRKYRASMRHLGVADSKPCGRNRECA